VESRSTDDRDAGEQSPIELRCALEERLKELDCLYGISEIVERSGGSLDVILQEIVELLTRSWEHSDVSCARITLDGMEFKTDNYANTNWKQVADLRVHGEVAGVVEVGYLTEKPLRFEGPFVAEERRLLNAVAERTGHIVERLRADHLLRQREEELRGRLTHLTRVSTLGEMASSIAHEVNQPLTAIATYSQACRRMLESGVADSGEVVAILARVTDEALRAGAIIHRLKNLARRHESRLMECDVNELVTDLEQLASVDTRLHDVSLELRLADSLPTVLADGIQIQQVVLNLIRNAVDAMIESEAGNRQIIVHTALRDSSMVQISVTDFGSGLPADCDEELFQPFFTTKKDGMGMGLSVSRSIVDSHGGQMWFSRNQGGGTTFFVTVPIVPEEDDD
jgi:C4-dicarboxylate-specific signal transduction histidine kinase